MANVAELRELLGVLTERVTSLATSVGTIAARADAPAPASAAGTGMTRDPQTALLEALVLKLATKDREYDGQVVQPFDTDITQPGIEWTLPAEPKYKTEHSQLMKNEGNLFKFVRSRRVDPRKGSRTYYDNLFYSNGTSSFKHTLYFPTYDDYIRGTRSHHTGMLIVYARFAPGGTLEHLVREDGAFQIWNAYLKKSQRVAGEALKHISDFKKQVDTWLDNGHNFDLPPASRPDLLKLVEAHNNSGIHRLKPVLQEFRDYGVKRAEGARFGDRQHRADCIPAVFIRIPSGSA